MADISTVNVPGLGLIEYGACLASGGGLFECSPIGQFVSLLSGLFAGVPTMLKTEQAVARLSQSKLWQFQALAKNLGIWVKNAIPLSTGNATYRAQLTGWIHGTIYNSGLNLRVTPQGYDQFSAVNTVLWRVFASQYAYSANALDQIVTSFQRVNAYRAATKPPPPKPVPPPPLPVPNPQPPPLPTPQPPPPKPPPPVVCPVVTPASLSAIAISCFVFAPAWPEFLVCVAERLGMSIEQAIACRLELALKTIWDRLTQAKPPPPKPVPDPPVPSGMRNLTGPMKALNPTRRPGRPSYISVDCGCQSPSDDEMEEV